MEKNNFQEKYENIIKLFFRFRHFSLNELLANDDVRNKFYIRINNYNKIFNSNKQLPKKKSKKNKKKPPPTADPEDKQDKNLILPPITPSHTQHTQPKQKTKKKTYLILGGYPDIEKALKSRGWIPLENKKSDNYDFIFTLKTSDIPFNSLKEHQLAGHFWKNGEITRKIGLLSNIRNLYFCGIQIENFFPRCYDLSEKYDYEDFLEDFKTNKAISILKKFVVATLDNLNSFSNIKIKTCINILKRKIHLFTGQYDSPSTKQVKLVSDSEWKVICEEDLNEYEALMKVIQKRKKLSFLNEKFSKERDLEKRRSKSVNSKKSKMIPSNVRIQKENSEGTQIDNLMTTAQDLISKISSRANQTDMNGSDNIWIMKPSGLSRGRGITCVKTLNSILKQIISSSDFIIQKYIENPLIIKNRKFDIRQWVLVTGFSPLTIWLFETPYLRFSAEDYDVSDITNRYAHLTNNSVGKHCENFENSEINGNMWTKEQFESFLNQQYVSIENPWRTIQEKIKKIVICSLYSVKHKIANRKNSFEIFGYDIMVDKDLNCYLIEVNSSPAFDYSTPITKVLVKEVCRDLIKVVIDYADAENSARASVDTGKFKLIYRSNNEPRKEIAQVN